MNINKRKTIKKKPANRATPRRNKRSARKSAKNKKQKKIKGGVDAVNRAQNRINNDGINNVKIKYNDKTYKLSHIMSIDPFFLDKIQIFNKYISDANNGHADENDDVIPSANPYTATPYYDLVSNDTRETSNTYGDLDNDLIMAMPYNNNRREYSTPVETVFKSIQNRITPENDEDPVNPGKNQDVNRLIDSLNTSLTIMVDPSYLKKKDIYNKYKKKYLMGETFDSVPVNHRTRFRINRKNNKSIDYFLRKFLINLDDFTENYLPNETPMSLTTVKYTDNNV